MKILTFVLALAAALWAAAAADPSGKWTASFDTQIGTQSYTYTFKVDGRKVTGTAVNAGKSYEIRDGKFIGGTLTFLEMFEYQGQEIPIEYTGKLAGEDEIRFTRKVAEYAVEEFVAKRAK